MSFSKNWSQLLSIGSYDMLRIHARLICWEGPDSRTRTYPAYVNWPFGTHCLWWEAFLSLDIVRRGLVLPQFDILDFVDSPVEALTTLRSGWVCDVGR